jgi:hypothetical protein
MNPQELSYLMRAVEALKDPELTQMAEAKILRTVSQISDRASREIELKLVDKVTDMLYNTDNK